MHIHSDPHPHVPTHRSAHTHAHAHIIIHSGSDVHSGSNQIDVAIEHPAPGAELIYIPNIPLWLRIRKAETQCFEVFLNDESKGITCDHDTILDVTPIPGKI